MDKSEIREAYGLTTEELTKATEIFKSVNPSRRIEYIDQLVAAGFNGRKIRAVSHLQTLRFEKTVAAREEHINKVAEAIFIAEDFGYPRHFAACVAGVLKMCGYVSQIEWIEKKVTHFKDRTQ